MGHIKHDVGKAEITSCKRPAESEYMVRTEDALSDISCCLLLPLLVDIFSFFVPPPFPLLLSFIERFFLNIFLNFWWLFLYLMYKILTNEISRMMDPTALTILFSYHKSIGSVANITSELINIFGIVWQGCWWCHQYLECSRYKFRILS